MNIRKRQQAASNLPPTNEAFDPLVSMPKASEVIGVHLNTLYNWKYTGRFNKKVDQSDPELTFVKVGSRLFIRTSVLKAFIEACGV